MISNPIPWPNGLRCAVAITWDMDADSGLNYWNPERADTMVASQTLFRYGLNISVPRLVELGRRFKIKQTLYVPGWCIDRYPHAVDLMADNGDEVALHGYLHERSNELSKDDELYWFERGLAAFEKHFGRTPAGWRAPSFAFSKYSLRYLIDAGFQYDSSLMGDDVPYLLDDQGDTLIELPTQWSLDDWPYYAYGREINMTNPITAPQRALEVFRAEFDAAWKYGGLWISVWHPFLSGRLARIDAVIELIEYMQAKGDVWFATTGEIADHVNGLLARKAWTPNVEKLPAYDSPLPEFSRKG